MTETPSAQSDPAKTISKLSWLREFVLGNVKTIVGGALLTGLTLLWLNARSYTQGLFEDYVTGVIAQNLEKNEALREKIIKVIEQGRKHEVGATTVGRFTLTPSSRTYNVYIYCPPGHTPKLYYDLSEYTKTRFVEAQAGNSKWTLKQQSSIPLPPCGITTNASSGDPLALQGIDVGNTERHEIDDLIAVTFQLSGPDVDQAVIAGTNSQNLAIDVRYAAFVSPAIKIRN
jgi:hypothetical protein